MNELQPTTADVINASIKQIKESKYTPKYVKYIDENGILVELIVKTQNNDWFLK